MNEHELGINIANELHDVWITMDIIRAYDGIADDDQSLYKDFADEEALRNRLESHLRGTDLINEEEKEEHSKLWAWGFKVIKKSKMEQILRDNSSILSYMKDKARKNIYQIIEHADEPFTYPQKFIAVKRFSEARPVIFELHIDRNEIKLLDVYVSQDFDFDHSDNFKRDDKESEPYSILLDEPIY